MASFSDLTKQFAERWKGITLGQKLVIGALAASSIVAVVLLSRWAAAPDLGLLYSGLDPKDAAEIVNELDAAKIPYQLRDGGTTIMAPTDRVYALRLRMASQGLPQGGAGFEIFDKANLGMTDFAQQVNYVRALQGELARTIGSLQQVEWARVLIVKPERALFVEDQKPASASVVVKMRSGTLSDNQIAGITHLVASSVEGLRPENVVITDDRGNLLAKGTDSSVAGLVDAQLDLQKELEDYLASKAQAMLEHVLGPGRSVVKVSAELDLSKSSERKIEYGKDANKLPSKMVTRTTTSQTAGSAPGAVGTAANLPGAAPTSGGSTTTSSDTEETTEYYEPLSHTEVEKVNEPGQIRRLSVAAFISAGTYQTASNPDGTQSREYRPLDETQREPFVNIIKQAVGYDASRGDEVIVHDVAFSDPAADAQPAQPPSSSVFKELVPLLIKYGAIVAVAAIFVVFGLTVMKKTVGPVPAGTAGQPAAERTPAAAQPAPGASAAVPAAMSQDVNAFATHNVADTTRVLRQWLQENVTEEVGAR